MGRILASLIAIIFSLSSFSGNAQINTNADRQLMGDWKGTSLCQVKNSPCHDEVVVYHIYKQGSNDSFYIRADKIVNGVEEDMGILPCVFDRKANRLSSSAYGTWSWLLSGDELEGTLIARGTLYRKIKLKKLP